jgi:predicted transcriptional regulator
MSPTRKRSSNKSPKLDEMMAPLEAEAMAAIWKLGPSLVWDVEEVLNARHDPPLNYKTVLTLCTRLVDRGLLKPQKEEGRGRAIRYIPTMTKEEFVAQQAVKATDTLLSRFGDAALVSFVDQVSANPEQLAALRNMLGEAEKR